MSEIAVQGCSFSISSAMGQITATSIEASPTQSEEVKINDKGVFFDKITAIITGASITVTPPPAGTTGHGTLASGQVDVTGTASNICELPSENKAVQNGDNGTEELQFLFETTSTPPSTTPLPVPVTITVTDAGQTDVIAT